MKKISLVFTILVLSCSISFAGTLETVGKMASKAKSAGIVCSLINGGEVCSDIEDVASVARTAASVGTLMVVGASPVGLATIGAAVGGGMAAGAITVVAAPLVAAGSAGAAGAKLMNDNLYTDCQDQAACDAAQSGTYIGAAAGTAASVGTLVVVGAGPAGLATIGAVVGGGMAAGAITVLAVPLVAASVIGGTVYWLFSD